MSSSSLLAAFLEQKTHLLSLIIFLMCLDRIRSIRSFELLVTEPQNNKQLNQKCNRSFLHAPPLTDNLRGPISKEFKMREIRVHKVLSHCPATKTLPIPILDEYRLRNHPGTMSVRIRREVNRDTDAIINNKAMDPYTTVNAPKVKIPLKMPTSDTSYFRPMANRM